LEPRARLRVSLAERAFEVEGSESFVRTYAERIEALLELIGERPAPRPQADDADELESFGAFFQRLPRSVTDVDRMLAAAYHAQRRSTDNAFATAEANRLLGEQGVRIGNPSQAVRQNLLARRVFAVERGRYRISQQGLQHLGQLVRLGLGE
jgi:hypothetical protein